MNSDKLEIGDWVEYLPTGERGRIKSIEGGRIWVVFNAYDWSRYYHFTGQLVQKNKLIKLCIEE